MNVNKISKQFVEQDEEIVFVIEKLLNSAGDRVILVLPRVSALTSSAVSLKILARQLVDAKKLCVLVTDNENTQNLAKRAQLAVRNKISDVDKDAWLDAKNLKQRMHEDKEILRKKLLGLRTPETITDIIDAVVPAKVIDEEVIEKETFPIPEKPRLKSKIVDLNGIKIVSGGDIAEFDDVLHLERIRLNATYEEEEQLSEDDKTKIIGTDIAINHDYGKNNKKVKRKTFAKVGNKFNSFFSFFTSSGKGKKIIFGLFIAFFVYAVYAYYVLAEVEFTLFLKKEVKPLIQQVTADADVIQSSVESFIIKSEVITKTASQKAQSSPTGKGQSGTQASGEITIFNLKTSEIVLPAGTILTENKTGKKLKYHTNAQVTVPAAVVETNEEGLTADAGSVTVSVQAETFGTDYNMTGTTQYQVGSYSFEDVNAKSFMDFTPSVIEEVTVVSKEDIEALKASLIDQLKLQLSNDLVGLLAVDDILLSGSQTFTEVSFVTTVQEGQQVVNQSDENLNFEGELKMTVTAMKISKTELKSLLETAVNIQQNSDVTSEANLSVSINDPVIENVTINARKATFQIRANATLTTEVDETKLKELIKSKTVEESKEILRRFSGVEDVRARYNPSFIPYNIQMVPDKLERVSIRITLSN